MSEMLQQKITAALGAVAIPTMAGHLTAADCITYETRAGSLLLTLELGVPELGIASQLQQDIANVLREQGLSAELNIRSKIPAAAPANSQNHVEGVKNIVAVASGKGGVGKSTTAVNIALALAKEGASVGILDADIYGPSMPQMLGVADQRPEMGTENTLRPIDALGIKLVSMGNLVTENTPMVWRGPMVSGALQQLVNNTMWQDVDYLIVDMPPGTGDIQLTLSQTVPVSAAVIVTTPQDIALLDAKRGIEMFSKVNIPILGIVENMATHTCSHCGHKEAIFGETGGAQLAEQYQTPILGQLPLQLSIRAQTDAGKPPVAAEPSSAVSLEYIEIARQIAASLWLQSLHGTSAPEISVVDD